MADPSLIVNVTRRAMRDFTFSDGTVVPKGAYVFVAARATHLDEDNYPNPNEFQGFRFSEMREDEGESTKHQTVALGLDWVIFGGGKHAWFVVFSTLLTCLIQYLRRFA